MCGEYLVGWCFLTDEHQVHCECEWQSTWPGRHLVYDDSCSSRTSEGWRPRTEPCLVRWRPPLGPPRCPWGRDTQKLPAAAAAAAAVATAWSTALVWVILKCSWGAVTVLGLRSCILSWGGFELKAGSVTFVARQCESAPSVAVFSLVTTECPPISLLTQERNHTWQIISQEPVDRTVSFCACKTRDNNLWIDLISQMWNLLYWKVWILLHVFRVFWWTKHGLHLSTSLERRAGEEKGYINIFYNFSSETNWTYVLKISSVSTSIEFALSECWTEFPQDLDPAGSFVFMLGGGGAGLVNQISILPLFY